jgi:hypothetical protein
MGPSGQFHGQAHQGHPMNNMSNSLGGPGGGHPHMMGGPQVDRLDPRYGFSFFNFDLLNFFNF